MSDIKATWSIELYCDCPHCKESVDLLDFSDFWDEVHFEAGEHDTDRTKDIEVICPKCDQEFIVDCVL